MRSAERLLGRLAGNIFHQREARTNIYDIHVGSNTRLFEIISYYAAAAASNFGYRRPLLYTRFGM